MDEFTLWWYLTSEMTGMLRRLRLHRVQSHRRWSLLSRLAIEVCMRRAGTSCRGI